MPAEQRVLLLNISGQLIDIISISLNQLNLYADLGVPEIWRYDGRRIEFYQLQNGEYAE
jgi:Uma2 family endonuclease